MKPSRLLRAWTAFCLIAVLPVLVGEPTWRELRRAWRNLAIRSLVGHELETWRGYWREFVRGEP